MASDPRRLPTLVALEQELRARARAEAEQRPPAPRRTRAALIVAVIAAAIAVALSPLGATIAEAIEDLIGIGDEPTRELTEPVDEPAVVIGLADTPSGDRFEIVASSEPAFGEQIGQALCVSLDFPQEEGVVSQANCLSRENVRGLLRSGVVGTAAAGEPPLGAYTVVSGFAHADSTEVTVTASGIEDADATIAPLDTGLAERIATRHEFVFFIRLLPRNLPSERVRVSARSASGRVVGRASIDVVRLSEQ